MCCGGSALNEVVHRVVELVHFVESAGEASDGQHYFVNLHGAQHTTAGICREKRDRDARLVLASGEYRGRKMVADNAHTSGALCKWLHQEQRP
jgi:hypothetical protein